MRGVRNPPPPKPAFVGVHVRRLSAVFAAVGRSVSQSHDVSNCSQGRIDCQTVGRPSVQKRGGGALYCGEAHGRNPKFAANLGKVPEKQTNVPTRTVPTVNAPKENMAQVVRFDDKGPATKSGTVLGVSVD